MIRRELAEILQKTLGLNIASVGTRTLERSINKRVRELNLANQAEYVRYLRRNRPEIDQLIDAVVIPETWFFRDPDLFNALQEIAGRWCLEHPQRKIKILSIPCASGEEPYSIAMAMLESGWSANSFQLEAVDISTRIIERAKEATYTKNSFRSVDLSFRDRYFTKKGKFYALKKTIAAAVHFHCGNILDPEFMAGLGLFDIIFCRNILFYLDLEAQRMAVRKFAQLLEPEGYLFVGAAEALRYLSEGFLPLDYGYGHATILRYRDKLEIKQTTARAKGVRRNKAEGVSRVTSAEDLPGQKVTAEMDAGTLLHRARQLADEGLLEKARETCQEILRLHGPLADVYYLLGILSDFSGNAMEAVKYLKKALYLLPDHEESLLLLIYLSERLGDKKAVTNYKRRLSRLKKKRLDHGTVV